MLMFSGTPEEFEAVRSLFEKPTTPGERPASAPPIASNQGWGVREPTAEEAHAVIGHRGGLSNNQQRVLGVLAAADERVRSREILSRTGFEHPSFRGVMGVLPRRVRGALGSNEVRMVNARWIADAGEYEYWLPATVREAYQARYG